jgi:hypothetical protein
LGGDKPHFLHTFCREEHHGIYRRSKAVLWLKLGHVRPTSQDGRPCILVGRPCFLLPPPLGIGYLEHCDRTTSEMRSPSSRIQIWWFSTKQKCMQTLIRSIGNHNFIEIKLLHFSLKITRMTSRRCFKRYIMFVKAFHSVIKDIHHAQEVKNSFGNSTHVMGSSTESST